MTTTFTAVKLVLGLALLPETDFNVVLKQSWAKVCCSSDYKDIEQLTQ